MSRIDDLVAAAKEKLQTVPTSDVEVAVGDELVTLRFSRMPAGVWLDIAATHPPRIGAAVDSNVGFNVHAVGRAAAVTNGALVEGDTTEQLTAAQWEELFSVLSGPDLDLIGTAVWALNDYDSRTHKQALKKASALGAGSSN